MRYAHIDAKPVTPRRQASRPKTRTIRFDTQLRANEAGLRKSIAVFTDFLRVAERELGLRKRQRRKADEAKFSLAVEALSCNLLVASMIGEQALLAIPRGYPTMWSKSRYASPVYGKHFLDATEVMAHPALGLIRMESGWRFSEKHKKPSTIAATPTLARHLPLSTTDWSMLRREVERETIILKASKNDDEFAPFIEYRDTGRTRKWRNEMRRINAWLASTPISVDREEGPLVLFDERGQPIDPNRRTLCRHFNNGQWNHGGRLAGGFWMNMARADRFKLIRIAGEQIANVDYGQLFPRLAYVRARADQPSGDLYDIGQVGTRAGWKILINALLFAKGPLRQWPTDLREEFVEGTKLRDIIQLAKERHAPIAHLFEKGIGFELMFIESEMLIRIVLALFERGVTALPLHDSVLVARSQAETAKDVMEAAFREFTEQPRAFVGVDYPSEIQ